MRKHFLNFPAIYKLGTRWIGYLPRSLSYGLSSIIADISYNLYRSAVKTVTGNLQLVFPYASDEELHNTTKMLFRNYARYLVDYGRFTSMNAEKIQAEIGYYTGIKYLDEVLRMKKGVILLTAHLGNWELGGIFFGSYGLRTNVVTLPDENPEIDGIRRWYRERYGVNTITIGNSPFSTIELMNVLNRGELVAMLIDRHNVGLESIKVDFLNKQTPFPRGPFILSRLTCTPIIVAFVVREAGSYKGIIERPMFISNEREEIEGIRTVAKTLEKYVRLYPDQWYNFIPI